DRITSGPAFDYAPRYSPDGRTIVFCSDRGGNMNLWLMNADGSRPYALTEEKDAILSSPSWTPDGLYVLARREDTSKAGIPPVEIFMYHRDGGSGIKIIAKDKIDTSAGPIASPDGRYIYLTGRQADFSQMDVLPASAFTPDGRSFVYWTGGKIHRLDLAAESDSVIPFSANVSLDLRPLLRMETPVGEPEMKAKILRWPTLSPDGKLLAFDAIGKIWVCDVADGKAGKPRRLTKDAAREYGPEFSP